MHIFLHINIYQINSANGLSVQILTWQSKYKIQFRGQTAPLKQIKRAYLYPAHLFGASVRKNYLYIS